MDNVYDVIIIGAGPAGLSAGLYAGRSRLKTAIIEHAQDGGQIAITSEIENYPGGSVEPETGPELVARMTAQAARFGCERISDSVTKVDFTAEIKKVYGLEAEYLAKKVIIATGAKPRLIGCPGEVDLTGRGVSYCATCDAPFFKDLEVFVVGGGDSAVEEAIYLSKFARKVTIIHRRDELRAVKTIQEKAFKVENIHYLWDSVVEELAGEDVLDTMKVKNVKTGEITSITADPDDGLFGVFVFIGFLPNTKVFEGAVAMDGGYILTDEKMKTNVDGVYAAGDLRIKSLRQVITAASDGAIAAMECEHTL